MSAGFPSQVDPRGLLTFGFVGLSLLVLSVLLLRGRQYPRFVGIVGVILSVLFIYIYLARLIVLDPNAPLLAIPVILAGFVVSPIFYFSLGATMLLGLTESREHASRRPDLYCCSI